MIHRVSSHTAPGPSHLKGLYKHFKTIADSVKIPCILYNVPSRTGLNMQPQTLAALAKDIPWQSREGMHGTRVTAAEVRRKKGEANAKS